MTDVVWKTIFLVKCYDILGRIKRMLVLSLQTEKILKALYVMDKKKLKYLKTISNFPLK